jgi:cytochrome b
MTTIDESMSATSTEVEHRVWDLPVRVFHWTLVLAIIGAFVTNRLGVAYFQYHIWCGYIVLVLILFRIIWGIIGTKHARFSSFLRGPQATIRYVAKLVRGRDEHYAGHNPLGAWMVVTLLSILGIQAVMGLFANDEIFNTGPLSGYVSQTLSLRLTSLHRYFFYWIIGAVALHIFAVVAHSLFKEENLVRAMMTGRKSARTATSRDGIHSSRTWLALLVTIAVSAGLAWIVGNAPAPTDASSFY